MKLDGAEIVRRHRTRRWAARLRRCRRWIPPKGKGARLQELIASQSWERRPFEVQNGGSCPEHANWGTVEGFCQRSGLGRGFDLIGPHLCLSVLR